MGHKTGCQFEFVYSTLLCLISKYSAILINRIYSCFRIILIISVLGMFLFCQHV
jgi:hypothetical protein